MENKKYYMVCMTAALLFANAAPADDTGFYWGLKAAQVDVSVFSDDATNFGALAGWDFGEPRGFAVEAEYTRSVIDGEIERPLFCISPPCGSQSFDYEFESLGAYLVWRSKSPVYFKGRLGYASNSIDIDGLSGSAEEDAEDDDIAAG
ncbi:MAG: outer membrane beta-barrel protein, partial [Gammaproteobacteria bacterium]|nr:outer membrane beta-barrel protein [Gammaproteobacteria bacterium]